MQLDYPLSMCWWSTTPPMATRPPGSWLAAIHAYAMSASRAPGLDWARNRAIQEARGEILAFTDDDAIVDPGWVTALVRVFAEDPEVMAVTGLVVPYELETDAQHLFERYGGFGRGYEREWHSVPRRPDRADTLYIGAGLYGTGANMAYRRRVFETIGAFDPALDVGTVTLGGGDLDMFFRCPAPRAPARVRAGRARAPPSPPHAGRAAPPARRLGQRVLRLSRPQRQHGGRARGPIIRFGLWYFWRRYVRRLLASLVSPTVPRALILAELRGALAGVSRYRRARAAAATIAATPVSRRGDVRGRPPLSAPSAPTRRR
jgi:glycosyltransferase involved in cell wall biosynthesis